MMRPATLGVVCLLGVVSTSTPVAAQPKWDTHPELRQWVGEAFGIEAEIGEIVVEEVSEGTVEFIRIWAGRYHGPPLLTRPAILSDQPAPPIIVAAAGTADAVRLRVRHTLLNEYALFAHWLHDGDVEDAIWGRWAMSNFYPVAGDGEWHDVVIRLTDSRKWDSERDVVKIGISSGPGKLDSNERSIIDPEFIEQFFRELPPDRYFDLDSVEFLQLGTQLLPLQVDGFQPQRVAIHGILEIQGTGFSPFLWQNDVDGPFGTTAVLVEATATTLRVEMGGRGTGPLVVRGPGGQVVQTTEELTVYGPARSLENRSGDGQTGIVGETLQPLIVATVDLSGEGVPGTAVTFRVVSSSGSVSVVEATTDATGEASTTLTLGATPGQVRVEAKVFGLGVVTFVATATTQ